ncbi:MAG: pseudaminic acid cytidylyltransferase [Helicobacteraceae bacterium]|jgi:N-acylneuraminate cytidylyltransferase|nr:pseudaminic acid cytidylyltransferase [Helicobacteraceae bacterium]
MDVMDAMDIKARQLAIQTPQSTKTIAVIPARGGSKRIKRKNIRDFCGKPIIAYPIEAALNSLLFDSVIVSTDDEAIAAVAIERGAAVPFMRPIELSGDFVGVVDVVAHAIGQIDDVKRVCLIYATAPFVSEKDLINAYKTLGENDYVLSISAFEYPIERALKLDKQNRVSSLWKEHERSRSQDLIETYHDAAHFCFGKAEAFLESRSIFNGKTVGYIIDKKRVQDIDTIEDWERAELMYKAMKDQ